MPVLLVASAEKIVPTRGGDAEVGHQRRAAEAVLAVGVGHEVDRAAARLAAGDDLLERGEHRHVRALAVDRAAAVEHAVLDVGAPRVVRPVRRARAWTVS